MTQEPFTFAGFTFPRKVPIWRPLNRAARRPRQGRESPWCFAYHAAPTPFPNNGKGFYLESDFAPGLRWQWCDKVEGVWINHEGWFSDTMQDQTIRGIVFRLPHGRGFLAGWSMGEHMASEVGRRVYSCEREAARAADREAESVAEAEREREEGVQAGWRAAEAWQEGMGEALDLIQAARTMRRAARAALARALAQREGEAAGFVPQDVLAEARRLYRAALESSRAKAKAACEARAAAWREVRENGPGWDGAYADGWREGWGSV